MNHPANRKTLDELQQSGLLNPEAHSAATRLLEQRTNWSTWVRRVLLVYGGTLTLVGIVYFFAYNWQEMGKTLKFAVIEIGILACVYGAWKKGFESTVGRVFITSDCVLVGVLLAVFGQTYQTGADPYGLFLGWAALIFGFVVASRFSGLWYLWLALLNIAGILYWKQVAYPAFEAPYEWLCLGLAALNGLALAFREIAVGRGLNWLNEAWLRPMLLIPILLALTVPTIDLIANHAGETITALSALIWAAAAGGIYFLYRQKFRDSTVLCLVIFDAVIVVLTLIGKALAESSFGLTEWILMFAFAVLVVTTGATVLSKHEIRALTSPQN